jgi:hypothetical protein
MKLQDFLPDIANRDNKLTLANQMLANTAYGGGFKNYLGKSFGDSGMKSAIEYYGIEQLY